MTLLYLPVVYMFFFFTLPLPLWGRKISGLPRHLTLNHELNNTKSFYLIFSFVLSSFSSSNRDDVYSLLCLIFCLITYVRWQSVPEVYRYDQHKYRASYNNGGTAVRFSPSTPKRLVPQASPLGCEYWLVIMYVCMYQYVCLYVHLYVHFCQYVYLYIYH